MKQSKKLLSIVLAMIMALGCFSVAVSAAYPTAASQVSYSHQDKGELNSDQLASLVMDLIDDALADLGDSVSDYEGLLSFLGIELGSWDELCGSLGSSTLNTALGKIGGDVENVNFDAIEDNKRSDGDTTCLSNIVKFLADNTNAGLHIERAAYGLTKNSASVTAADGISGHYKLGLGVLWDDSLKVLGISISTINLEEELSEMEILDGVNLVQFLDNIPQHLKQLLYDTILNGSYDYTTSDGTHDHAVNMTYAESGVSSLTYDEIVSKAIIGLLTDPQDYEYVDPDDNEATDNSYKVWDETSRISNEFAALSEEEQLAKVNLTSQSFFDVLDGILPIVWSEYGVHNINNGLKWAIMDAVNLDTEEISYDELPASIAAQFGTDKYNANYCHYGYEDLLVKDDATGLYYYTNVRRRTVGFDDNGEEITSRIRVYYVIDPTTGNDIAPLINFDYEFTESDLDTAALVTDYGSIAGSLNHLVYLIFNKALNVSELNYGTKTYSAVSDFWTDGGSDVLQANLVNAVKIVLKRYTAELFGKDHSYVDATTGMATEAFAKIVDDGDIVDLIEYIGLPFFEDAMPQLVLPTPNEGASYVFDDGVQLYEFGAIVLRELITEIAPYVNYDSVIYKDGTLTSATGRQMATHSAAEWRNIILSMGTTLACGILYNETDYSDTKTAGANRTVTANYDWSKAVPTYSDEDVLSGAAWKADLQNIINWALDFIGSGSTSALYGLDANTVKNAYTDPVDQLSYILNTILPLGFVNGCTSEKFDFDINLALDKIFGLVDSFDLAGIVGLFGRNTASATNILSQTNISAALIETVNKIFKLVLGKNLFPTAATFNSLITQGNVSSILVNLVSGLSSRSSALLTYVFPIVGMFTDDWCGDDESSTVEVDTDRVYIGTSISATATISIERPAGLWLSYMEGSTRNYDSRYKYNITGAKVVDINGGTATNGITASVSATTLNESQQECTVTISGTPTADYTLLKVVAYYDVVASNGTVLGTNFTAESDPFVVATGTDYDTLLTPLGCIQASGKKDTSTLESYGPVYINTADPSGAATKLTSYEAWHWASANNRAIDKWKTRAGVTVTDVNGASAYGISLPGSSVTNLSTGSQVNETCYAVSDASLIANIPSGTLLQFTFTATAGDNTSISSTGTPQCFIVAYNSAQREALYSEVMKQYSEDLNPADYEETAWNTYWTALVNASIPAIVNDESAYKLGLNKNYTALLETLVNAETALEAAKLAEPRTIETSGTTAAVNYTALQTALDTAEATVKGRDYYDYYGYRWTRYRNVRNDANDILDTYNTANAAVETTCWSYNDSIKGSEVATLAAKVEAANANYKADYINALVADYSAEDIALNTLVKENAQKRAKTFNAMSVADTANNLTKEASRLVLNTNSDESYFLDVEIKSCEAQFTAQGDYTARSWANYQAKLADAKTALSAKASNTAMYDAKYELLKARNDLKTTAEEADYTELETLVAQAQQVFANAASYENGTADFAALVAALGVDAVDDVVLFPNSASVINADSYDKEDQEDVDRAADALRAALAKMTFTGATVKGASEVTVGTTEETTNVVEITSGNVSTTIETAFADFEVAGATGAEVSTNATYAIGVDNAPAFVGTGAVITFYKEVNSVKIPVATVTVMVKSDINGDGILDVLDAMNVELAQNSQATLNGVFFNAAKYDTANANTITATDYQQVVSAVVAA